MVRERSELSIWLERITDHDKWSSPRQLSIDAGLGVNAIKRVIDTGRASMKTLRAISEATGTPLGDIVRLTGAGLDDEDEGDIPLSQHAREFARKFDQLDAESQRALSLTLDLLLERTKGHAA